MIHADWEREEKVCKKWFIQTDSVKRKNINKEREREKEERENR